MRPEAHPISAEYERRDSCVLEVRFSVVGLYIVVEAFPLAASKSVHVEVLFPFHSGFQLLDEGDMPAWLGGQCYRNGHIVYEVTSGGWLSRASADNGLSIASATCREWLVVTANECVSIFATAMPSIRELSP